MEAGESSYRRIQYLSLLNALSMDTDGVQEEFPVSSLRASFHIIPRLIANVMNAAEEIKLELGELSSKGDALRGLIRNESASPEFIERYQEWYTRAIKVVSLLGKDRLDEFRCYYQPYPRRDDKLLTNSTYVIQDYISGVGPDLVSVVLWAGQICLLIRNFYPN